MMEPIKILYRPKIHPDFAIFVSRETYGIHHAMPSLMVFHMIRYKIDRGLGYDFKHLLPQPDNKIV